MRLSLDDFISNNEGRIEKVLTTDFNVLEKHGEKIPVKYHEMENLVRDSKKRKILKLVEKVTRRKPQFPKPVSGNLVQIKENGQLTGVIIMKDNISVNELNDYNLTLLPRDLTRGR